jgi:polyhydroxyalkanoate synthesis regulator phasin
MANYDKMIEAQKAYSEEKVAYAKEVVDVMVEHGEAVTPYSVWKKSKLAKSFIYSNKEVAAYIEEHRSQKEYNYRKLTEQDVAQERIDYLEKEIAHLRKELKMYKEVSVEALLTENQLLKHRLTKYEKLAEQGLIQLPKNNE